MWDSIRLSAVGNFSLRKIALLLVTGLTSALFVAIAHSTPTFADDAAWNGDAIKYNGHDYTKESVTLPGISQGYDTYVYKPTDQTDKAYVIAVKTGADKSQQITDAQLREYKLDGGTTYSSPGPPTTVGIAAQTGTDGQTNGQQGGDSEKTSCGVVGIGWIVCNTSRFLAGAMDKIYGWISNFLVIKPLTTDTNSGLHQAWDIAKNIANAAFIVAFLIIVYSQITSVGISNYEIKKMIPRLIIAAILVNASYYICTIAIDVSNIMGDSVQKALMEIRGSLPAPEAQTTWGGLTSAILSGAAVTGTAYLASAEIIALVPLLVPVLIGGILSVLIALMVLAARQAIVTVLVVLAPIAFVAYLLPNTEKQFERWRGLFVNMLMIFPLFSLLFGGSQLASYLIIQNTDQISVVILAMAVQVAPLAITPFLMKVSHGLLTQIGGLMNNPRKGLVDRSRNWANEHSQIMRNDINKRGAGKSFWTPSGLSYRRNRGSHIRAKRLSNSQDGVTAAIANEKRMRDLITEGKEIELQKNAGEAMADAQYQRNKTTSKVLQRHSGNLHTAQLQSKAFEAFDEAKFQEALSDKIDPNDTNHAYAGYALEARSAQHALHVAEANKEAAEKMQSVEWVSKLKDDRDLQLEVGGIDPHGAMTAYNKAKSADVKRKADLVSDIQNSTSILPGEIYRMDQALREAINEGNAERARAYINLLAESNDPGVHRLRMTLRKFEPAMQANGIIDDVRFHISSHAGLNNDAEDMVNWSRQDKKTLKDVGHNSFTWSKQSANKIIGQKRTSQLIAIKSGGVSDSTMREILLNPAKVNIKEDVLKEIRKRLKIDEDGREDDLLKVPDKVAEFARRSSPPPQNVPDPDRQEDYRMSIQPVLHVNHQP